MPPSPAFSLHRVHQERAGIPVLHDVSLDLPAGTVTSLIGPSGAGKSSLLRLLNRLDDPMNGEIRYHGQPITTLEVGALRRRVGYVFQTPVMFPGSVADNLAAAAQIAGLTPYEIQPRITETMHLAELDGALADRDGARLSIGQQQRVNLARALMTRPETLLLDEPTASLDPETTLKLSHTIARLSAESRVTVITATHRLAEARGKCSYVVMLEHGRLVEAGLSADLFERSTHPRVRAFLQLVQ